MLLNEVDRVPGSLGAASERNIYLRASLILPEPGRRQTEPALQYKLVQNS